MSAGATARPPSAKRPQSARPTPLTSGMPRRPLSARAPPTGSGSGTPRSGTGTGRRPLSARTTTSNSGSASAAAASPRGSGFIASRPPWDDRVNSASQAEALAFTTGHSDKAVLQTRHLDEKADGYDSLRDRGMQPYFAHNRAALRHMQGMGFVSKDLHIVPHADRKLKMLDLAFQEIEKEQAARDTDVYRALTIRLAIEKREQLARAKRAGCKARYTTERKRREGYAQRMSQFDGEQQRAQQQPLMLPNLHQQL